MRPALLNPLFAPVTSLSGVGPKQDRLLRYLLDRNQTPRLVDLLLHLPASVIDRRARPKIRDAVPGTVVTLEVTVDRHRPTPGRNPRAPHLVYASDDTGDVVLTYFRSPPGYVEKLLPVGARRYVSGTLQMYDGIPQIVHPDRVVDEEGFAKLSGIDPVYPLTEGLALGSLRRAMVQALLAAAAVTEVGKQAALMAPTEILARQHIKTITPLAERAGMRVAILTGREKGRERRELLARLEAGEIDLLVGTHALIQDDVVFKALALAVVDEQHRFGVRERLALTSKGEAVDVLVLSATPIPRTLVLTYFGDMDVSELREKPAGRQPIDTRAVPNSRLDEVIDAVGRALKAGKLVYWICPLVEESEAEGIEHLTNATQRFESLQRFGDRVGLVHGQMRGP